VRSTKITEVPSGRIVKPGIVAIGPVCSPRFTPREARRAGFEGSGAA